MFLEKSLTSGRQNPKHKTRQYYCPGNLLPTLTVEQLLAGREIRKLLLELETQSQLSPAYFSILYQQTLAQFSEMVQLIPYEENGILAGLLNRGISRAVLGLRIYRNQAGNDQNPMMNFAIFSAALLSEVPRVFTHYSIAMTDAALQDDFEEWQPFSGSMKHLANYYKLFPKVVINNLENETAALFARQLLAPEGFLWLGSDGIIFNDWLLALRGVLSDGSGKICHLLSLVKQNDLQEMLDTISPFDVEIINDPSLLEAEKCYLWLRDKFESDATLFHIIENQMYIHEQNLEDYIKTHSTQINLNTLRHQLERLFIFRQRLVQREHSQQHQHKLEQTNQQTQSKNVTALGFLNKKQSLVNSIVLPIDLLLKKQRLNHLSNVQTLPDLSEKKRSRILLTRPNIKNSN